ncbi:hypothetical protein Tco_0172703 [Tanacetum coccineum]
MWVQVVSWVKLVVLAGGYSDQQFLQGAFSWVVVDFVSLESVLVDFITRFHAVYWVIDLNGYVSSNSAIFTNEWDLASLEYSQEIERPYCTDLPTPDDIRRLLELERVVIDRTIKSQTVALNPNQILTKELSPDMKQWEELIRENVIECVRATPTANLPYDMFLTRLYRYVMETYPHLDNGIYDIVDRVMRPLALKSEW